jgi:hypothetical protein
MEEKMAGTYAKLNNNQVVYRTIYGLMKEIGWE